MQYAAAESTGVDDATALTDTGHNAADAVGAHEDDDDGASVVFRPWPPALGDSASDAGRLYAVQMHMSNASGQLLAYKFRANVADAFRIQPHSTGIIEPYRAHTLLILWTRPQATDYKARLLLESKFASTGTAELPSHTPLSTVSVRRLLAAASPVDVSRTRLTAVAAPMPHSASAAKCELLFRTAKEESKPSVTASGAAGGYKPSSERTVPPTPPPSPVSSPPPSGTAIDSPPERYHHCVHNGTGNAQCAVSLRCWMAAMLVVIGVLLYFSLHICVHFTVQMPRQYYKHDV